MSPSLCKTPPRDRHRVDVTAQQHCSSQLDDVESNMVDSRRSVGFWFSERAWVRSDPSALAQDIPSWVEVFIHKKSRLFLSHLVAILWQWPWSRARRVGCGLVGWWKDICCCFSTQLVHIFYLLHWWWVLIEKQMNKQQTVWSNNIVKFHKSATSSRHHFVA